VRPTFLSDALRLRSELTEGRVTPAIFSAALAEIPPQARDQWLDLLCDLEEVPVDDAELPRGCVPYLPCAVATVLDAVQRAAVTSDDVFVDVGSGAGRAALLVHLATGASCVGLEIQPALVELAQERADRFRLTNVQFVVGDAADATRVMTPGTVFFLYCPFGGERLQRFLEGLQGVARSRPIRLCCVDMPPLEQRWLTRLPSTSPNLHVYRSRLRSRREAPGRKPRLD